MNYKYVAFMSNGEIMETNNFHYLYNVVRYTLRNDDKCKVGVIAYRESRRPIATLFRAFNQDFIYDMKKNNPIYNSFLPEFVKDDKYGMDILKESIFLALINGEI